MSAFTSKIHELLKTRYWYSKSTRDPLPQDELSPYDVVLTRLVCLADPARVAISSMGDLWVMEGDAFGPGMSTKATVIDGINFAPPPISYWNRKIDNDEYLVNGMWFREDYTLQTLRASRSLRDDVMACLENAAAIMAKLCDRLDWVPVGTKRKWKEAIQAGGMPVMWDTSYLNGQLADMPAFLRDRPLRQYAWNQLVSHFAPINKELSDIGASIYAREAAEIDRNVAFWSGVSKWTGVDAITGLWDDLKAKIREFNGNQNAAKIAADGAQKILDENPALRTPGNLDKLARLRGDITANSTAAQEKIPDSIKQTLVAEVGGLGVAPIVVAAIGGSLLAITISAVAVIATASEETARNGQKIIGDFASQRESMDNAWYLNEKAELAGQLSLLNAYYGEGVLSEEDYQSEVVAINQELASLEQQLIDRRQQSLQAVTALSRSMKDQQQKDAISKALDALKGAAIPISVGLGLLILGPSIARMLPGRK